VYSLKPTNFRRRSGTYCSDPPSP